MTSQRGASPTATSKPSPFPADFATRVLVIFGTRPEAIKLCPLISTLREPVRARVEPVVCVTGQHREMLDQVLRIFDTRPDFDLNVMQPGQLLPELTARLLIALTSVFDRVKPAITVVQGDTNHVLRCALIFLRRCSGSSRGGRVAHLRSSESISRGKQPGANRRLGFSSLRFHQRRRCQSSS
jgi:UDP-N-acetylglucosamine 2-epimerase